MKRFAKSASALAFAGVVALGATPVASAAPLDASTTGQCASSLAVSINAHNALKTVDEKQKNVAKLQAEVDGDKLAHPDCKISFEAATLSPATTTTPAPKPNEKKCTADGYFIKVIRPEKATIDQRNAMDSLELAASKYNDLPASQRTLQDAKAIQLRIKNANIEGFGAEIWEKCPESAGGGLLSLAVPALIGGALLSSNGGSSNGGKAEAPKADAGKPAGEKAVEKGAAPQKGIDPNAAKGAAQAPAAKGAQDGKRGVMAQTGVDTAAKTIAALMAVAAAGAAAFIARRKFI